MKVVHLLPVIGAAATAGCGESALAGGFDARPPAARMQAIEGAARAGDRSPATLRRLVEQLDSDDIAVRLYAIAALERLTGETHGYRADDPPHERRIAVERWEVDPALGGVEGRGPRTRRDAPDA